MNDSTLPTCSTCLFALDSPNGLTCYRFPPVASLLPPAPGGISRRVESVRPLVAPGAFCGEHLNAVPQEEVAVGRMKWKELSQLDREAALTLDSMPESAEVFSHEDEEWRGLYDEIDEIENAALPNVSDHIKAGLKIRIQVAQ